MKISCLRTSGSLHFVCTRRQPSATRQQKAPKLLSLLVLLVCQLCRDLCQWQSPRRKRSFPCWCWWFCWCARWVWCGKSRSPKPETRTLNPRQSIYICIYVCLSMYISEPNPRSGKFDAHSIHWRVGPRNMIMCQQREEQQANMQQSVRKFSL